MRHVRLPPRKYLRNAFFLVLLVYLTREDGSGKLSRNTGKELPPLRNNPEESSSQTSLCLPPSVLLKAAEFITHAANFQILRVTRKIKLCKNTA
jgi:hypothetical protein